MSKLTDWEVGQELIKISDMIAESVEDIENSDQTHLVKKLQRMRADIGNELGRLKSHEFGIYDSSMYLREYVQ